MIPFYTNLYFKPEGGDGNGETKVVKIPLKINPKEGDSKLNMTLSCCESHLALGRQYKAGIGQFRLY